MTTATVTNDYLKLTVAQRIKLIGDIWDSVIADGGRPPLSDELKAELELRIAEDQANPDAAIPWEEVKRAARRGR